MEERADLVGGQRVHLLMLDLRKRAAVRRIRQDQLLRDRLIHGRGDDLIDVPHRLGAETLRLLLGLRPDHPALGQELLVELLQVKGGQLIQRDIADVGLDVVFDVALISLMRGRTNLDEDVILEPHVHPLSYRVLSGFGKVQLLRVGKRLLELFTHLCLRFAKNVFVNRFPGFGIMTRGVAALPAPVLALTDAAFAISSAFCHVASPSFAATNNTPKEPGSRAKSI